jgi:hypothetical protein
VIRRTGRVRTVLTMTITDPPRRLRPHRQLRPTGGSEPFDAGLALIDRGLDRAIFAPASGFAPRRPRQGHHAGDLSDSTSYAIADAAGSPRSVSNSLREAPLFYGLFTFQIVAGAVIALARGNLVTLVVNAQVLNGFITPVLLTYVLILANRRSVLGDAVNGSRFRVVATICVAVVAILSFPVLLYTPGGLY